MEKPLLDELTRLRARIDALPSAEMEGVAEELRTLRDSLCHRLGPSPLVAGPDGLFDQDGLDVTGGGGAVCAINRIRELLADAIGCVSEGFVLFDASGRLILCNERYREAYPLLADRLKPGVTFADLLELAVERGAAGDLPDDPEGWISERLTRHTRRDQPSDHRLANGNWYRISEHSTRFGGVVKILTDITELKRHEQALAESEVRYRQLVETAPYGIVIWDGKSVRFANRGAAHILDTSDLVLMADRPRLVSADPAHAGVGLFESLPDPDQTVAVENADQTIGKSPLEARVSGAGGALLELEVDTHAYWLDGHPAWLVILNDVTQRKQAERAIHQSQKMQAIGQLAGGIAHEFNNMLTAIGGFARMARRATDQRERVESCLGEIIKASERASALTGQLLSFGRPGRLETDAPLQVANLLEDARRFMGPMLGERYPLTVEVADPDLMAVIDPGLLHQSLVNLVLNARDASRVGGAIQIRMERVELSGNAPLPGSALPPGSYVAIRVVDQGTGIEPELLDRLFEPFFTTKEPGAGTGLGLSLVYSTITRVGGRVEVESVPGRGSTFTLLLPAIEGGSYRVPEAAKEADSGQAVAEDQPFDFDAVEEELDSLSMAASVLLVEDEEQVREFIRMTLEDMGMRVTCAADGQEALRLYKDNSGAFDLLVTDLVMARIGGAEVARRLRQENPDLPVLLISGYAPENEGVGDLLNDSRRVEFLRKPVTPDELAAKIKVLVV